MPLFTIETIRREASRLLESRGLSPNEINVRAEFLRESRTERLADVPEEVADKPAIQFDIFLSHSSLDSVLVLGLYKLLRRRGYTVYVDWIHDPMLNRTKVDRATCRILRYRMAQCRCLFVATTTNIPKSAWVPWELGFFDGWNGKAAVLPIVPAAASSFNRQEYFDLYPLAKDSGAGQKPNDIEVWELRVGTYNWGTWLMIPRKF
jgi:hypothetical protein